MRTTHQSNVARLHLYPEDINDPDSKLLVLFLKRSTYGDSPCACTLEILLTQHVAKRCKTPLGVAILLKSRYVDDILAGANDRLTLWAAILDIEQALGHFDFSFKHVFSSNLHHITLNEEGGTDDGQFSPDDIKEVVFHHTWFFREDVLQNIPSFFPGKKTRGCYT